MKECDARDKGQRHAAQHGEDGIQRKIDLPQRLDAAIGIQQVVDRRRKRDEEGKQRKFQAEAVHRQQNGKAHKAGAQRKDRRRPQGAAALLFIFPVEQELKREHGDGGHDDTVIHRWNEIKVMVGRFFYACNSRMNAQDSSVALKGSLSVQSQSCSYMI